MNRFIFGLIALISFNSPTFAQHHHDVQNLESMESLQSMRLIDRGVGRAEWMTFADALKLGEAAHAEGRCGGYFDLTGQVQADPAALPAVEMFRLNLSERELTQQIYLGENMGKLDSQRLFKTVTELSAFKNRYYQSPTGVQAAEYIAKTFQEIAKSRNDVKVQLFKHSNWAQPSVVATIAGTGSLANEVVVIGGHEDSISGFAGGNNIVAPGADDNASGVATVLEVFRVMIESGFKPNRTLAFMTYAAEEVGLRGSQEIANSFKNSSKVVVGVVQFDMTGYVGSGDEVVFINDFTDPALTKFSQKLMDTYVKAPWSNDKCGYGCSDHASWMKAGYPAIFAFESAFKSHNSVIHTPNDLISQLDFKHGLHFAKLGLSFVAELAHEKASTR